MTGTTGPGQWEADYLEACKRRCRLYAAPYVFLATQLGEPAAAVLAPLLLPTLIEASWGEADDLAEHRYQDAVAAKLAEQAAREQATSEEAAAQPMRHPGGLQPW